MVCDHLLLITFCGGVSVDFWLVGEMVLLIVLLVVSQGFGF